MKTRFILLVSLVTFSTTVFSQWNGSMYWEIRQRFLDKYIRVGEGHGMSIPVTWMLKKPRKPDILVFQDLTDANEPQSTSRP